MTVTESTPVNDDSIDPRFYKLMAEALVTVEDALGRVRSTRTPRPDDMRALTDAVANYIRLCDEWCTMTAARKG